MGSRIDADGGTITMLSLTLVGVLAVASFSLSFLNLIQAAAWAGIPTQLRWLVPVVVDSTILVYSVAATVQHSRGDNTTMSWLAVGFFTTVSVAANAAHVLAPAGVLQTLTPSVVFGAFLASIMPISLFFATHTTVALAVAPVQGTVAQRRRRAAKKAEMDRSLDQRTAKMDHPGGPVGPRNGPSAGPRMDHRDGPRGPVGLDHTGPPPKPKVKADPEKVLQLAGESLSQRAIAERLGCSKTSVARILAGSKDISHQPESVASHVLGSVPSRTLQELDKPGIPRHV